MEKISVKFSKMSKELNDLCASRENITRKNLNLGRLECELLQYLDELDTSVCMNDISEKLNVSHSRITRLVDTLVQKDLVKRFPSQRDRRSWLARITEQGKAIACDTMNDMVILQERLQERFPNENFEQIMDHVMIYLKIYNEILNEKGNETDG
jgi:DNA-binding MarR family transcriptional regulator